MMKQPLQANTNRTRAYYPIETKKSQQPSQAQQPPPQATTAHHHQPQMRIQKVREREIDALRRQNQQLRERQEVYIDKLMKLEEGLENQHSEFIKLQELYTELFESYKHKEAEIMELQTRFRESDRFREERNLEERKDNFHSSDSRGKQYSFQEREWSKEEQRKEDQWIAKELDWQAKEKSLTEYIESLNKKIATLGENYERVVQELSMAKGRDKSNSVRAAVSEKTLGELQEWQRQVDQEKESRLKYQYQNEFLKSRNADLETQREELEKLLAYKQKEINKLREEKIKIHRQSSEKFIQRSPAKAPQPVKPAATSEHQPKEPPHPHQSSLDSNQYFSFSRERHDNSIDSELPSFPPELQIDSLITEYKK